MRVKLPLGTKVEIISIDWGGTPIYTLPQLVGCTGKVVDHDDDHYTPENVVELDNGFVSYFLSHENLKVI